MRHLLPSLVELVQVIGRVKHPEMRRYTWDRESNRGSEVGDSLIKSLHWLAEDQLLVLLIDHLQWQCLSATSKDRANIMALAPALGRSLLSSNMLAPASWCSDWLVPLQNTASACGICLLTAPVRHPQNGAAPGRDM